MCKADIETLDTINPHKPHQKKIQMCCQKVKFEPHFNVLRNPTLKGSVLPRILWTPKDRNSIQTSMGKNIVTKVKKSYGIQALKVRLDLGA